MAPFSKLFSSSRSTADSMNVHDSCALNSSDSLVPTLSSAAAYPCSLNSCGRAKAWSVIEKKLYTAYRRTQKYSKRAVNALKQLGSCTARPVTKEFLTPPSDLIVRSNSSIYFECEESFSMAGSHKPMDIAKYSAGSDKKGASKANEVHIEVMAECIGAKPDEDSWDNAPGVERLITKSGLGQMMDNLDILMDEDNELGELWG